MDHATPRHRHRHRGGGRGRERQAAAVAVQVAIHFLLQSAICMLIAIVANLPSILFVAKPASGSVVNGRELLDKWDCVV